MFAREKNAASGLQGAEHVIDYVEELHPEKPKETKINK